jgi:hypothetical protein
MGIPRLAFDSVRFVNTSESTIQNCATEADTWFDLARWACTARHSPTLCQARRVEGAKCGSRAY